LIRVSFGTTLIASIVIVFTAIIAILSSSKRYFITEISQIIVYPENFCGLNALIMFINYSDDDRGGRRRSSSYDSGFGGSGFNFFFSPSDLFW
jgi:hypothetical protein